MTYSHQASVFLTFFLELLILLNIIFEFVLLFLQICVKATFSFVGLVLQVRRLALIFIGMVVMVKNLVHERFLVFGVLDAYFQVSA